MPSQSELPDPLTLANGQRVTSQEQWFKERRPELKALFQRYMYGQMPPAPVALKSVVQGIDHSFFGGKATKREVTLNLGVAHAPEIHVLLIVPNGQPVPAPVFVGLNFFGNHTVVNDPAVALPTGWVPNSCAGCTNNRATDSGRGTQASTWSVEQTIDRGYGLATFYVGDIEADRPNAAGGVRSTFPEFDWGTIAAWAWGASRVIDYLATEPTIDPKRIAIVGHSRNGKAAIVAAAFDERIALAIPLQAGCGGTSPNRGKTGESVKQINERFPHWFNAEFKKFNDQTDRLPFDQHCLIALCAPRPVLLANALEDQWANPKGQFEMLQAADPVYRLLRTDGLNATQMPAVGQLVNSTLGYYLRPGQHSMTQGDWLVFLDFADKHLKGQ